MDLVSFESPEEFRHFAEMIFAGVKANQSTTNIQFGSF